MSNVLFIAERGDNASAYYRATIPAKGLAQLGHRAIIGYHLTQGRSGQVFTPGQQMTNPEVVVTRRMTTPEGKPVSCANMFAMALNSGQQVWLDLDDDFWHLPEWNPARQWVTAEIRESWVNDANSATGVVVSTPELAAVVREQGVTSRVEVSANSVDAEQFRAPRQRRSTEPLRLGWLGETSYRGPDLASIATELVSVLRSTSVPVEFWWLGSNPRSPHVKEFVGDNFPVPIEVGEWAPIEQLPDRIGRLDVAIVPQADTVFALSRSAITGLALAAGGVPFAATATPAYERLFNMGAGYPVHEPVNDIGGWVDALRVLIEPEYQFVREEMRYGGLMTAKLSSPVAAGKRYAEIFGIE